MAGDESRERDGLGRKVLGARVPVLSALAALVLVAVLFTVVLLTREDVDLGGAVDGAVEASVTLTICNETVDRRGINPRTAELDFQEGLEDLGVRNANVTVNRINCGPDSP